MGPVALYPSGISFYTLGIIERYKQRVKSQGRGTELFLARLSHCLPGLTGLAIVYCMDLLEGLDWTVRECLEVENMMTSVERVISYTNLESEPGYSVQKKPPIDWPWEGRIEVENLRLVYYSGGPQVLRDLNLSVAPAEKVGIAGRTGAGM